MPGFATRPLETGLKVVLAGILLVLSHASSIAEKKVALLIGNSSYSSVSPLQNPTRDVSALAKKLRDANFEVVAIETDLTAREMTRALREFEAASSDADVGLVFYAGHGMEVAGRNYLIPVDAQLSDERVVRDEAISLDRVLESLAGVRRLRLVLLDACRDNPWEAKMKRGVGTRSVSRGLARVEPNEPDTLIGYSAAPGKTAADGDGENSPFTAALLKWLTEPNLDVQMALRRVRDTVREATNNAQEPYYTGSLGGMEMPLRAVERASAQPEIKDQCRDAAAHWAETQKLDQAEFYQNHLELFGSCPFAAFARARLAALSIKLPETASTAQTAVPASTIVQDKDPSETPPKQQLAVAAVDSSITRTAAIALCDKLASSPYDQRRRSAGVAFGEIDTDPAYAACSDAHEQNPADATTALQLARVELARQHFTSAQKILVALLEQGDARAYRSLGVMYESGLGVETDHKRALEHFRAGSKAGDPFSTLAVGRSLLGEYPGISQNPDEARHLLEPLEKINDPNLLELLGETYSWINFPLEPAEKQKKASELLERAVELGSVDAIFALSRIYLDEPDLTSMRKGLLLLLDASSKGNALALNSLGYYYEQGLLGIVKDESFAAKLYGEAAEKGNEYAISNLAGLYFSGRGVQKNVEKTLELLRKNATFGNVRSQYFFAKIILEGEGKSEDVGEALRFMRKAAAAGYSDAKNWLESSRPFGIELTRLRAAALSSADALGEILHRVSDGDTNAMLVLADMYATGYGVLYDQAKAFELSRQAANGGNGRGMFETAVRYEVGLGTTRDLGEAERYYRLAEKEGNFQAAQWLKSRRIAPELAESEMISLKTGRDLGVELVRLQRAASFGDLYALREIEKRAEDGDTSAMMALSDMYGRGIGTPFDEKKAFQLSLAAASKGNINGMFETAVRYEFGVGVPRSLREAERYYGLAANEKEPRAVRELARLRLERSTGGAQTGKRKQ